MSEEWHRKPVPISPIPNIDTDLDPYDTATVINRRDTFFKEQLVRMNEIHVLKDKLRWCYRREGVNHLQNCRYLADQYLEMLKLHKFSWMKPWVIPEQDIENVKESS